MDNASKDTTRTTTESRDEVRVTIHDTRMLRVALTALAEIGKTAEVEFAGRGVTFHVLDGPSLVLAELSMPAAALRDTSLPAAAHRRWRTWTCKTCSAR